MNIVVLDITSRNAVQYNPALCNALADNNAGSVVLLSTENYGDYNRYKFKKLFRLVPLAMDSSRSRLKRILRALEVLINYIYVFIYVTYKQPDIVHFQWLPFIDVSLIEKYVLWSLKKMSPRTKVFLTVHNIYPHNILEESKAGYRKRFLAVDRYIDGFLVHLESSKNELISQFGVEPSKVNVAYHGVYVPDVMKKNKMRTDDGKKRIIMYGFQTKYKGADILVDALSLLPNDYLEKLSVCIVGKTDPSLYTEYINKAESFGVEWINRFVSDEELYDMIDNSDVILLPYREISQSGVLLLALSYKKCIFTSDLPSFRETLDGYDASWFFKQCNPLSLSELLTRYIDGEIDDASIISIIDNLNSKYSWNETAKATIKAYESSC